MFNTDDFVDEGMQEAGINQSDSLPEYDPDFSDEYLPQDAETAAENDFEDYESPEALEAAEADAEADFGDDDDLDDFVQVSDIDELDLDLDDEDYVTVGDVLDKAGDLPDDHPLRQLEPDEFLTKKHIQLTEKFESTPQPTADDQIFGEVFGADAPAAAGYDGHQNDIFREAFGLTQAEQAQQ